MRSRDSGLQLETRNTVLARDHPQLFCKIGILHHLVADWDQAAAGNIMKHRRGVSREPQSSATPTP